MTDFENALRGTMSHQNLAFEQADADLRAETNTASLGIENLLSVAQRSKLFHRASPAWAKNDFIKCGFCRNRPTAR
jgi:hypothetical protein